MHSAENSEKKRIHSSRDDTARGNEREHGKYLTFTLLDERFGIAIDRVKELIEYCSVTRVPLTPSEIHGVINLRGSVVPIINIANRIGKESRPADKKTCIVIVEIVHDSSPVDIGFVVDEVEQVIDLSSDEIEPTPPFGMDVPADYISGMGTHKDSFIILLDLETVLSGDQLSNLISKHGF